MPEPTPFFWPHVKILKTMDKGLSLRQAQELLEKFGPNKISEKRKKGRLSIFFSQFNSFLVLLLPAVALVFSQIRKSRVSSRKF